MYLRILISLFEILVISRGLAGLDCIALSIIACLRLAERLLKIDSFRLVLNWSKNLEVTGVTHCGLGASDGLYYRKIQ